ncbi:MAG: hypothetical protein WA655_24130 [Candidatus Korobacteraceae bacterium]
MKKALLCLTLLACVASASAASPNLTISPSPVAVVSGNTQQFTASFDDGSQVANCTWLTTGSVNAIQSTGVNTAVFAAGSLKATYVLTATCTNSSGFTSMGIAIVAVT